jgi:hypothetical protein
LMLERVCVCEGWVVYFAGCDEFRCNRYALDIVSSCLVCAAMASIDVPLLTVDGREGKRDGKKWSCKLVCVEYDVWGDAGLTGWARDPVKR